MKMARWNQICLTASVLFVMCVSIVARSVKEEQAGVALRSIELQLPGSTSALGQNFVCSACLHLSNEAQAILENPDTEKTIEELLSNLVCENIAAANLKAKCRDLLKTYVPDLVMALEAYLRPEICTESGVCKAQLALGKDTRTCAICQEFASDALNYLGSNKTKAQIIVALHLACSKLEELSQQCDLLVDVYAPDIMQHLNSLTPEEFCEMSRLCKPALTTTQLKRNDCAVCQFVVLEMKYKLRDPKIQEKLLEALGNGCDRVVNHVDECKMIVAQYAPFILANLDSILDADVLCTKIGACAPVKQTYDDELFLLLPSGRRDGGVHAL